MIYNKLLLWLTRKYEQGLSTIDTCGQEQIDYSHLLFKHIFLKYMIYGSTYLIYLFNLE